MFAARTAVNGLDIAVEPVFVASGRLYLRLYHCASFYEMDQNTVRHHQTMLQLTVRSFVNRIAF
jgi:hypothetical protein